MSLSKLRDVLRDYNEGATGLYEIPAASPTSSTARKMNSEAEHDIPIQNTEPAEQVTREIAAELADG